jgi:RNA polymerase sigma-70 factor (ECF subfamily)
VADDGAGTARESLERARCGDPLAFAALVRGHQRMVYSLALRMLSDRHEAEDVAQEAFMQLHRCLSIIQSGSHLVFWLRKVTTHLAIDRLRRGGRHEELPADCEPQIAESNDDPLLQRQMRGLVAALAPDARAVVLLRYQEDLDPTEIAEMLDMSINTVKSHLRRSLIELRKKFQDCSVMNSAAAALPADEGRDS